MRFVATLVPVALSLLLVHSCKPTEHERPPGEAGNAGDAGNGGDDDSGGSAGSSRGGQGTGGRGGSGNGAVGGTGSGAMGGEGGEPAGGAAGVSGSMGDGGMSGQEGGGAGGEPPDPCVDGDGDGYGIDCTRGPDCNDFEARIHPGALEACGNAFDDDCNPKTADNCPITCPPAGCGIGCADGQRESFSNTTMYPHIAGCSGGWSIPGIARATTPACGRVAGDDSTNPNGDACSAADLCASGWHVCRHPAEVAAHSPDGCVGSHDAPSSFFVARQSGSGCGTCAVGTDASRTCTAADCSTDCYPTDGQTNDVFGCGTIGNAPSANCAPLDRFGDNDCRSLPTPWDCVASDDYNEALVLRKLGPAAGGVLCCVD